MRAQVSDVARYLRMGGRNPEGALAERIDELCDEAEKAVRPGRTFRRFPIEDRAVRSGEVCLPIAGTLARHLNGCSSVYLACGTLGAGFDAFQRRVSVNSGADALIVQAIGAAMIEDWMDAVEEEIRLELSAGESLRPRYSPGYGDFPLSSQRELLALLDSSRRAGISLTDSLLMVPSKSVSAVIGVL